MSPIRMVAVLLGLAAGMYVAAVLMLYFKQRSLVFYPQFTRSPSVPPEFRFDVEGAVLRGWVVNPGQERALLYFGGNGEDISLNRDDVPRWFPDHTVYLVSYRGYGHSSGQPSEQAMVGDAFALFDFVAKSHRTVDALGRSLGSGVATQVSAARPVGRLALITPFDSLLRVAQGHYPWVPMRWLLADRFESWVLAPQLTMPVLVVIAAQDDVIPPPHSEALISLLPNPPQVLRLPLAQHSTVQVYPEYDAALRQFFSVE